MFCSVRRAMVIALTVAVSLVPLGAQVLEAEKSHKLSKDAKKGYLGSFTFDEEAKKDVDITDEEPEAFERLTIWEKQWRETVKKDQANYTVKRR